MKRFVLATIVALVLGGAATTVAQTDNQHDNSIHTRCDARAFRAFSDAVWAPSLWQRGEPPRSTRDAARRRLARCPAVARQRMSAYWRARRGDYRRYREATLHRSINRVYVAHWAPDYGGRTLPFHVAAALFEAAGMPGVTMAQIAKGESGLRPGSAGVDPGGTVGYGILAITSPFADSIVAKYGGYEQMWNPVKNAAAASEIYEAQGLGAWYGTRYVTSWDAHYRGGFDLSKVLGGDSFEIALRAR